MDRLPILKSFILLSNQLNAFSGSFALEPEVGTFPVKLEVGAFPVRSEEEVFPVEDEVGAFPAETEVDGMGAGESNPAMASLLPKRISSYK